MAKRKMPKKILIAIPAGTGDRALCDATWESIRALNWSGQLDYLFMRHDEPDTPHRYNLRDKFNRAREVALSGDYDALLTVESDMIIPAHALQRLARAQGDIAYGLYCSRRTNHPWLATEDADKVIERFVTKTGRAAEVWGKVAETQGLGNGCTLIHRHVLEAIEFRCDPEVDEESKTGAPDWYLATDAVKHGFKQVHDFGVVCGHIISVSPSRVVWPIPDSPFYRVDDDALNEKRARRAMHDAPAGVYMALKPITSKSSNRLIKPGETMELDAGIALQLLRLGLITPATTEKEDGTNN
jgi:hypothetical protein